MRTIDEITGAIIGIAVAVHRDLGPGLLESAYQGIFVDELKALGLMAVEQVPISVPYNGRTYANGYRIDLLVEERVVVELKCAEKHSKLFERQLLTYLRCLKLRDGLLINMGRDTAIDGVHRITNFRVPDDCQP